MHLLTSVPARLPALLPFARGLRPAKVATRLTEARLPEARVRDYLSRLEPAYAPGTRAALASDWACFQRWCEANGFTPLPAAPATLVAYLEAAAQDLALATLKRRAATLSHLHDALGLVNPLRDPEVRLLLRGLARVKGTRPHRRRLPLRETEIARLLDALGPSLRDLRDRALILTARDTLARRAELAALRLEDLELRDQPGDGRAVLRRTKGDPAGRTAWLSPETCWTLRDWIARAGLTEGAVFRQVESGDQIGAALRPQGIARRFKSLAAAIGLDAARVGAHSTRLGMCVDLCAGGAGLVQVQLAGGWRSPSMPARYAADLLPDEGAVARYHEGRALAETRRPPEARPGSGFRP